MPKQPEKKPSDLEEILAYIAHEQPVALKSAPALDFAGRSLRKAILVLCDLKGSSFVGADLTKTCFTSCDLSGAIFSGSTLKGTRFIDCDLSQAQFNDCD